LFSNAILLFLSEKITTTKNVVPDPVICLVLHVCEMNRQYAACFAVDLCIEPENSGFDVTFLPVRTATFLGLLVMQYKKRFRLDLAMHVLAFCLKIVQVWLLCNEMGHSSRCSKSDAKLGWRAKNSFPLWALSWLVGRKQLQSHFSPVIGAGNTISMSITATIQST